MSSLAAIILAAGKGRRLNSKSVNKVVLSLRDKPMIVRTIDLLETLKISPIIVVIGFAKESVIEVLKGRVVFGEQKKRLGTAHAVQIGLKFLPKDIPDVLVLNGDDSAFYKKETINNLIRTHQRKNPSMTFLTIEVENPSGLGKIVRDDNGKLIGVVEDKDAREEFKNMNEVNPACYIFNVDFLSRSLKKIKKSKVTGEYYLTGLINLAIENNEKIEAVNAGKLSWRGINTVDDLGEAERIFEKSVIHPDV